MDGCERMMEQAWAWALVEFANFIGEIDVWDELELSMTVCLRMGRYWLIASELSLARERKFQFKYFRAHIPVLSNSDRVHGIQSI